MQRLRYSAALLSEAMKTAAQTLVHDQPLLVFGSRRSLFQGNSRLLTVRRQGSHAANSASCRPAAAGFLEGAPVSARFATGRLSFSSRLLSKEGERKVSTGAAAVRFNSHQAGRIAVSFTS
jgi:hypothetical protein